MKYKIGDRVMVKNDLTQTTGTARRYAGKVVEIVGVVDEYGSGTTPLYYFAAEMGGSNYNAPIEEGEIERLAGDWKRTPYTEDGAHFNKEGDQCIWLPGKYGGNHITIAVMGRDYFGGADKEEVAALAEKIQNFLNEQTEAANG